MSAKARDAWAELGPDQFVGNRCGRYRLCFEIASGGMATVFLARTEGVVGFGKLVALKRIHPYLAKEKQFVDMFLDEVRIASQLSHPNLCGVSDFGEADGSYYFTMEYLVGEPLARIERRLIAERERIAPEMRVALACRIVADAAEGLHSAHELVDADGQPLRVVHRDVSPSNIVVTYDGSVRVVDFGIAHAATRLHQTAVGLVKGKFAYMAPEQFLGGVVDRRIDVWALGVLLYELLVGRRLFRRESDWHIMHAVLQDEVPKLANVIPGVGPELDVILSRALERDVAQRYPTARELSRDLVRYIARSGHVCGLAEVADLMKQFFPDGRAEHQHLVSLAARLDTKNEVTKSEPRSSGAFGASPPRRPESSSEPVEAPAVPTTTPAPRKDWGTPPSVSTPKVAPPSAPVRPSNVPTAKAPRPKRAFTSLRELEVSEIVEGELDSEGVDGSGAEMHAAANAAPVAAEPASDANEERSCASGNAKPIDGTEDTLPEHLEPLGEGQIEALLPAIIPAPDLGAGARESTSTSAESTRTPCEATPELADPSIPDDDAGAVAASKKKTRSLRPPSSLSPSAPVREVVAPVARSERGLAMQHEWDSDARYVPWEGESGPRLRADRDDPTRRMKRPLRDDAEVPPPGGWAGAPHESRLLRASRILVLVAAGLGLGTALGYGFHRIMMREPLEPASMSSERVPDVDDP